MLSTRSPSFDITLPDVGEALVAGAAHAHVHPDLGHVMRTDMMQFEQPHHEVEIGLQPEGGIEASVEVEYRNTATQSMTRQAGLLLKHVISFCHGQASKNRQKPKAKNTTKQNFSLRKH